VLQTARQHRQDEPPATALPANIDYDLWCGPAPKAPLRRKQLHYDWHWVWDTGNGDIGNQGIHQMDLCRWALGVSELSPRVMSIGGRFGYDDDGQTPNTLIAYHEYDGAPLIFEVRGLPEKTNANNVDKFLGASVGCVIHCENGYLVIPNYSEAIAYDKDGKKFKEFKAGGKAEAAKPAAGATAPPGVVMEFAEDGNHFGNFIKAVRSRKVADLTGPIGEGHLDAAETYGRFKEHLAANGINLAADLAVVGPWLQMDPQTERFVNNDAANELLTRNYRAPFVVPEQV
jgi:predicted dehydrogenase